MKPYKDLTGQRFGNVTILGFSHKDKAGRSCWRAQCGCGNVWTPRGNCLKSGATVGCAKCRSQRVGVKLRKGYKDLTGSIWNRIIFNAATRKHVVNITPQQAYELYEKQNGICILSGEPISFKEKTASLDRIDSSRGYEVDNIQWVHKTVNLMKNNLAQKDFLQWTQKVVDANTN